MYIYKYFVFTYYTCKCSYYNLTRSSTTANLVLNIVRVDGWGICHRIMSYNGLPIITEMSASELT